MGNDWSQGRPTATRLPQLRRHLRPLKPRNLLPHCAILFGGEIFSPPTKPTPELIAFCQKLTREIAVAFLTDEPLEVPLKGFPPINLI
ncbi:NACHT C-terminal alpha/beta 1 domain-containing protein [Laspinema olomoucense]|uniref:NACHT C-terminal alpha/beta 1 domain-containing protein n=1 Tax=Laspinema olomoucense TaxID=3231600 RepID=UPI0021BA7D86|nr:hypothetical protein [Laspinema sp. D3c]